MDSGEQYPFISRKNVRSALDTLLYTASAQRASPLEKLLLVDVFLADPDLPPGPYTREFALHQILNTTITENYSKLRDIFGLLPPEENAPLDAAIHEMTNDVRQGSTELAGWSLLYYRYVRTEINMSFDAMSEVLFFDQRTLRRYLQFAITRLTDELMAAEWSARIQQRKRRLFAELPVLVPVPLLGRDGALNQMKNILAQPPPHHVQVTGAAGIGKTAFVQEVLRQQIETQQIGHLVWMYRPESTHYVRRYLIERLLPESSTMELREYMLMYRVAIVLDDIGLLEDDVAALEELFDYLSAALVLFTSRVHITLRNSPYCITLKELSKGEAMSLLHSTISTGPGNEEHLVSENFSSIIEMSGGNPLAIRLLAQDRAFLPTNPHILDSLFGEIYGKLDVRLKRAWFMLALFPYGAVDITSLSDLWPSWISITDLSLLIRHHLVELRSNVPLTCILMASARRFIQRQYECDVEARGIIDNLVQNVRVAPELAASVDVMENILLSDWLSINPDLHEHWINKYWQQGVKLGHWAKWCDILDRHSALMNTSVELQIAYGVCLRYLSEWARAEQIFRQVIQQTGRKGLFIEQAQALLELSILFRYQGNYKRTLSILTQIESLVARIPYCAINEDLKLEHAQVAVDKGDGEKALYDLDNLKQSTSRVSLMKSEAYLLTGDLARSITFATQAIESTDRPGQVEARAYSIVGRSCERQENWQGALDNFSLALTLLEQKNDPFALTRAQVNLGALLIRLGDYEEASQLLKRAESVQLRLGDQAALAVTQHNLRVLEIMTNKSLS